jgi:hypothetical protein
MVLFAHANSEDVFFSFIVAGLMFYLAASFIQMIVIWRRAQALNAQLARMQEAGTRRTVMQIAVTKNPSRPNR